MKRLIILHTEYPGGPKNRAVSFKQFRDDIKKLPFIKVLEEREPKPEVIIEFPDDKYQEMYEALRKLDIVEIIDSILPPSKN